MAQQLVVEAEEKLWQLCWVDKVEDRLFIDLAKIEDDVTFTRRGMSFVNATGNDLSRRLKWMLTRARSGDAGIQLQSVSGK
jgi:hypothetical protein